MNTRRWISGIAIVALLGGCLGADVSESTEGSTPMLPETLDN